MTTNPEFFAARRAQPADILALVLLLGFLMPAGLVLVERLCDRIHHRLSLAVHLSLLTSCFFLIALPSVSLYTREAAWSPLLALAMGMGLTGLVWRFQPFSTFVGLGAVAALVFPFTFLLHPAIIKQVNVFVEPPYPQVQAKHSIVMLVVDELPTSSIVRPDLTVDAEMFPNFARLAKTSTWYRRATTVADSTLMAVPAILTGKQPRPKALPSFRDHPLNLFTLLAKGYRCQISESRTNLCPPDVSSIKEAWTAHIWSLAHDELLMIAHGTLPAQWKKGLPDIRFDFSDFGTTRMKVDTKGKGEQFREFVSSITPQPGPQLIFLHTVLPHVPWRYLPDGKHYVDGQAEMLGMPVYELWNDSVYLVEQNFQRHLLQATFTDRLLGEFLDKLEKEDLFEDSLLIVVADHGASFVPSKSRRFVDKDDYFPILSVPLFIKLPQQKEARVDDRPVQLTDLMPTLVDFLDIELGWSFDGNSILSPDYQPRSRKVVSYFGESFEYPAGENLLEGWLELKPRLFPPGSTAADLYRFGPNLELLGQAVDSAGGANSTIWDRPERYQSVDTASDFSPSWVRGTVEGVKIEAPLALAVNGKIVATGRAYRPTPEKIGFSFFAPPQAFQAGANLLALYRIDPDGHLQALGTSP